MRASTVALSLAALLLLSSHACAQEYMGLVWNQTVKEIMSDLDVGDVNGDGKMEVAVSGSSDGLVYLFDSNGNPLWKRDVASYINTVKVADVNGDGRAEVMSGHADFYVFNGSGDRIGQYNTNKGVFEIKTGDLNGDGKNDIVLASYDKGSCDGSMIYALDCSGSSCRELWKYSIGKDLPFDFDVGDYNGDGKAEVAVGTVSRASGSSKMNGCQNVFTKPGSVLMISGQGALIWQYQTDSGVLSLASGDLEGSGRRDIAAGGYPHIYALSPEGKLLWSDATSVVSYVEDIAVADLYDDNRSEVLVGSNQLLVFNGTGRLLWSADTNSRVYAIATGDVDNDKYPEAIVGSSSVIVLDNKGTERWRSPSHVSYGVVRAADIDGNGYDEVIAGSVKNVYVYRVLEYAKRVRADEQYRQAVMLSNTNPSLAIEKLREARDLYSGLNLMDKVSECINQISVLSDASGKASEQLMSAEADLNMSKELFLGGDYMNASKYAMSARDKYGSPQINNKPKVSEAQDIISKSRQVISARATEELILANASYWQKDYNASLNHALTAREYFDYVGDMDRRAKASEVADALREVMGLNPKNQTQDLIFYDLQALPAKIMAANPAYIVVIVVVLGVVFLMTLVTFYFWRVGRRKTLKVEGLHKAYYDREPQGEPESKAQKPQEEEPINHRRQLQTKVEKYRTTADEERKSQEREVPSREEPPKEQPRQRRIQAFEKYKPASEEPVESSRAREPPAPVTQPRSALARRTFESPRRRADAAAPAEAPRATTAARSEAPAQEKADSPPPALSKNKGIVKVKVCRRGLCLKTKIIKGSGRRF